MTRLWRATRLTFRSMSVRNYRLYFAGQLISTTGTWMQSIAQAWLVLQLTGSGVALGVLVALQFTPVLLAGAWGGVVADRVDKRRLLVGTQVAAGSLALVLGAVTALGVVQLWMIYVLALGLGAVNAIDNPARRSFVVEMVGDEHVSNAVSLSSAMFMAARVIGPAIAGLVIAGVGVSWCFLANGVSYGAAVLARAPAAGAEQRAPVMVSGLFPRPPTRLFVEGVCAGRAPRHGDAAGGRRDGNRHRGRGGRGERRSRNGKPGDAPRADGSAGRGIRRGCGRSDG